MKKTAGATLAAAALVSGVGAATAHSSTTADVYFHGGVRQAVFATKAQCAPHAASMAQSVTSRASSGYRFVPLMQATNAAENRANSRGCFPMSNGRWTYLIAYVAPTGKPVIASDERVQTFQAGWAARPSYDRASYYTVSYDMRKPATAWTQAQCVDARNRTVAAVKANATTSPLLVTECRVQGTDRWYGVQYFSTKPKGLFGETANISIAIDSNVTPNWYYDWSVARHGM